MGTHIVPNTLSKARGFPGPTLEPSPLPSAFRVFLLCAWLLSTTACQSSSVKPLNLNLAQRQSRADVLMTATGGADEPGTAALITVRGEVVYQRCQGLANLDSREAITPQTNFRLASISKQMTAMAVKLLAEDQRLSLDDTMVQHLPELKVYGPDITLRHLLLHTAGLPDVYGELPVSINGHRPSNRDLLPALVDLGEPLFPAGQRFDYCNVCYDVLAMVIEEVSGQSFENFLEGRIFQPLGMQQTTTYQCPEPDIPHRALGYRPSGGSFIETDEDSLNCMMGAGGIYASLDDMQRWTTGLEKSTLLPPQSMAEIFTSGTLDDGEPVDYGFGWTLETYRDQPRASHTGSWVGFRNYIAFYPQADMTVIMLSNRSDFERQRLADRLADLFLDLALHQTKTP